VRTIHEKAKERMALSAQTKREKFQATQAAKKGWSDAADGNKQAHAEHVKKCVAPGGGGAPPGASGPPAPPPLCSQAARVSVCTHE
jgi:hypothetical protein